MLPDDVAKLALPLTALPAAEDAEFMVTVVDVIGTGAPEFALLSE
jgi:hypothetical protein